MILDFRFQPHEADFLTTPSGAVQKVISQTPPSLRATSSINRGGVGDSSQKQGVFQLSLCL